jgi:hypothetical protein
VPELFAAESDIAMTLRRSGDGDLKTQQVRDGESSGSKKGSRDNISTVLCVYEG